MAETSQLSGDEVFHRVPADSTTTVVAFTAWAEHGGRHDFFKLLQPLPYAKLLVRDPHQNWFNTGLPGVGDSVEEIAERIGEELAELSAERVITVGASMGAYAAILFGCLTGAERAIALAPQTLIDPVLQPRFLAPGVELEVPDLAPIIRESPGTKIDLVAGWDDHVDVFHAQRVAGMGSLRVLALPGRTHMLTVELNSDGELLPFVAELIEGGTPELCNVDPGLDADIQERIAATFFAEKNKEWDVVVERIAPVVELHPDWPGPGLALGRALAQLDELEAAEATLKRAVRSNPGWSNPLVELLGVLDRLGKWGKLEQTIRDAIAHNPDSGVLHLTLARRLLHQERDEEARSWALRASELEPKLAPAVDELLAG